MRQIYRHVILLFLVFNLAACSTISGWFESDDDDATAPAELTDIDETVNIKELWSVDVGNGQGEGFYRLRPAIRGDMIYAAAADGEIVAVNRLSGDTVWEAELETPLSGGVGVYEDTLLVGSSEGYVLRLDANSGEKLWSTPLRGEILSAPQSNGKVVVAQTYDGRLQGLDYETGAILWTYDSNVPVLTIRGTSTPIFNNNQVYAGFANGRQQKASSFSGVAQGFSNVYVADEDGTLTAYMRNGQGVRWTQGALAYRELSRPTPVSSYVVVGDFEGYVHVLSQVDGNFVGRFRVDDEGIRADMMSEANVLYVYGNSGELAAYEITAKN